MQRAPDRSSGGELEMNGEFAILPLVWELNHIFQTVNEMDKVAAQHMSNLRYSCTFFYVVFVPLHDVSQCALPSERILFLPEDSL